MEFGGVHRDSETAGDSLVGSAFSEKLKDLQFARCQPDTGVRRSRAVRQDKLDVGLLGGGGQTHTGEVGKQEVIRSARSGSSISTAITIGEGSCFSFTFQVSRRFAVSLP